MLQSLTLDTWPVFKELGASGEDAHLIFSTGSFAAAADDKAVQEARGLQRQDGQQSFPLKNLCCSYLGLTQGSNV